VSAQRDTRARPVGVRSRPHPTRAVPLRRRRDELAIASRSFFVRHFATVLRRASPVQAVVPPGVRDGAAIALDVPRKSCLRSGPRCCFCWIRGSSAGTVPSPNFGRRGARSFYATNELSATRRQTDRRRARSARTCVTRPSRDASVADEEWDEERRRLELRERVSKIVAQVARDLRDLADSLARARAVFWSG
jgi:hypothetical protein